MRKLSISSAEAFLLVYSVTSTTSVQTVKTRLGEIAENRTDFKVGLRGEVGKYLLYTHSVTVLFSPGDSHCCGWKQSRRCGRT